VRDSFQWEPDFSGTSFEFWVRRCAAGKTVKSAGVLRHVACTQSTPAHKSLAEVSKLHLRRDRSRNSLKF
jgi:hypothetical protein